MLVIWLWTPPTKQRQKYLLSLSLQFSGGKREAENTQIFIYVIVNRDMYLAENKTEKGVGKKIPTPYSEWESNSGAINWKGWGLGLYYSQWKTVALWENRKYEVVPSSERRRWAGEAHRKGSCSGVLENVQWPALQENQTDKNILPDLQHLLIPVVGILSP